MKEKFVVSLTTNIVSYVVFILAGYLLALNLEINLIGIWVLVNSIVNLGFLFVDVGFETIHYQYTGDEKGVEYFGTFVAIKLLLIFANIIITLIIIAALHLIGTIFAIYLSLLMFSKILFSITNIFVINLKTRIKVFKVEIPTSIIGIGKSLSTIFLIFFLSTIPDPIFYLSSAILIFEFIYLILILILSKNEFKITKPKKELAYKYLKDAKPLIIFSVISVISTNLGNLILDYSCGHETLGYFSIVNVYIIPLLLIISGSLITVYLPLFSKHFERNNLASIKKIIYIIESYSSIIFLAIIIFIFLNGELIFLIFIPKYLNSLPYLYIMIFIPYLVGISRPYGYQILSGKKQTTISINNSIISILIIILSIILIPKEIFGITTLGLGAIGYAIALTIPWILWTFLNRYHTNKYFKIKPQKNLLLHIPIAFLAFLISFFIKIIVLEVLFQSYFLLLLASTIILIGIFLVLLFFFRELRKDDIVFFLELLKLGNYKESFKKEFQSN